MPVNGTTTAKPAADTSYTLIAYGKRSQASAFLLIKVNPKVVNPNIRPPVANAGPDQTFYRNTATLDGTRSYDPDGDPINLLVASGELYARVEVGRSADGEH